MTCLRRTIPVFVALSLAGACGPDKPTTNPEDQLPEDEALPEEDPVERAGGLVLTGRPAEGLEVADAALADDPENAELHYVRGMALQKLGRGDEALAAWERTLAINPELYAAHDGIGSVHLDAKRYEAALKAIDAALAKAPEFAQAHFNRGMALVGLRRFDDAEGALLRSLELAEGDVDSMVELAAVRVRLGKLDEARSMIEEAVQRAPNDPFAHLALGDLQSAQGEHGKAVDSYAKAASLDPELLDAKLRQVRALRRDERAEEALPIIEGLMEKVPESPVLWSDHGGVLTDLGQIDEALVSLGRALELEPKLVSAHRRRVQVFTAGKRCKEARASYAELKALEPGDKVLEGARADGKACKVK